MYFVRWNVVSLSILCYEDDSLKTRPFLSPIPLSDKMLSSKRKICIEQIQKIQFFNALISRMVEHDRPIKSSLGPNSQNYFTVREKKWPNAEDSECLQYVR